MARTKKPQPPLPECEHCGATDVRHLMNFDWVCMSCARTFAARITHVDDPTITFGEARKAGVTI